MGTARDGFGDSSSRKALRARRVRDERERRLVLRHRWYAGGIATALSAALVFAGLSPAMADDTASPSPSPSDTSATQETAPPTADAPDSGSAATESTAPPADEQATDAPTTEPTDTATDTTDTTEQPSPEPTESTSPLARSLVAPLSIVNPDPVAAGSTTLRISKVGARTASGSVAPLQGATFVAYGSTRGGARTGTTSYTCTTNAAGTCDIVVPALTGGSGSSTAGYWVYETAAPSGWMKVGNLGLGDYNSAKTVTPYSYFTNNVTGTATTYLVTADSGAYYANGSLTSSPKSATGAFADVRTNPSFPASCGLSIAIVFDKSTSISSSEMTQMRNAALGFVGTNGLGGTPSSVALYQFSTTASKFLASTSIAANQTAVNNAINSNITGAGNGYTNWDDAMRKVAFNGSESYDVVLFLTDGDPTVSGTSGTNTDTNIGFQNLEEGIYSANAVKSMTGPAGDRTKVVAVGIGLASGSDNNLKAISGNNPSDDFYTTNFSELGSKLHEIAVANCGGSVTVVKKTVDASGNTIDAQAGGWTFTGTTPGGSYIKTPGGNVGTLAQTTPSSGASKGAVNYSLDLSGGTARTLNVVETVAGGFTPDSVTCTGASPTGTAGNFSVSVSANAIISCTVVNRQTTGKLTLKKVVDAGSSGSTATTADWTLTGTGPTTGVSGKTGDAAITNKVVLTGDYALSEVGPAGWTPSAWTCTGGTVTTGGVVTVAKDANVTCQITNTAVMPEITLVKVVDQGASGGSAAPTAWTLSAAPATANQTSGVTGTMGAAAVTNKAVKVGQYNLSESGGPGGYTTTNVWTCTNSGTGTFTQTNTSVTVNPGNKISCSITNTAVAPKLTLVKRIVSAGGVVDPATSWQLTAAGAPGWVAATTGTVATASTATQNVKANTPITLGEVGPTTGYTPSDWSCDSGVTASAGGVISLALGQNVTCTITNTQAPAKLTVVKKDMGETVLEGATFQLWRETNGTAGLQALADQLVATVSAGTYNWTNLAWGTYYLVETVPPTGYDLATPATQEVVLGAAQTSAAAVVTFHNPRSTGQLTIKKLVNDPNGGYTGGTGKTFTGTYNCGTGYTGDFSVTIATGQTISGIPAGNTCRVQESAPSGGLLNDSFSWGATTYDPSPVKIVANQAVTLTITNPVVQSFGSLTVSKSIVGTPSGFTGTFTGTWQCSLTNGASPTGTWSIAFANGSPAATQYSGSGDHTKIPLNSFCTVSENTGALPPFADGSYSWKSSSVSPSGQTKITSTTTPVAFTVTNTAQRTSLQLVKVISNTHGGTVTDPTRWNGLLQAQKSGSGAVTFDHQQVQYVPSGTYAISELSGGPAGYELSGIRCSIDNGPFSAGANVVIPAGSAAVCQLTNTDVAPKLTLVKKVDNKNGTGSATPDQWLLTAAAGSNPPAVSGNGTATGPVVGGTTYTLKEQNGPSGYTPGLWSCVVTGTQTPFPMVGDNVTPVVGKDLTCEITNTAIPATGTVAKSVTSTTQQANGSWQITYDVVVTNNSSTSTYFYSLTDALSLGAGITPTAASWTGPGGTSGTFVLPAGTATLASSASLSAATHTHTYTVTVTATVSNAASTAPTSVCTSTEPKRAFRNTATMTSGGTPTTVDACAEPWFPTVTKTASAPTQNPDASWNVSYTVTVANPGSGPLQATLKDAFPAAPSGWSYAPATWQVTAVGSAPAPVSSTYTPGTTGTIFTGTLPASTSYAYTVSAKLVPSAAAVALGSCEAGAGLRNTATVTSGDVTRDQTACTTVKTPPVVVAKSVTATQQLADGTWQIDYSIAVTNTDPAVATVYTLTDLPQLGTGFTVVSGTWGTAPVANTPIAGGATQTYTYTIVASFDEKVQNPQLTCSPQETGAFSNKAVIAFPGGTANDVACSQPGTPTVAKAAQPAVQVSATQWKLTYKVTVSNTSGKTLAYTASDVPAALPANVTGSGWTATGPTITGGGSGTLTAGWTGGTGHTELAKGTIPNGATHVYTLTTTVTLGTSVNPADLVCSEASPTKGFWNTASVTNGIGGNDSSACTSVTPPKVSIVKSDATVAQGTDGVWDLTYQVSVTNESATASASYSLTDTPQFDPLFQVTVPATPWTPTGGGTPVANPSGVLAPSATATWTYHVTATADAEDATPDELATALRCTDKGEKPGGGFYNVATVTFPGGTASDAGCGVPATPTITKTAAAATYSGGAWQLSYTVTVTNGSTIPLAYTASDTPPATLPTGVTLSTPWAVAGPAALNGGTATLVPNWSGGDFAAGTLPAGKAHVYTVTAAVKIAAGTNLDLLRCSSGEGRTGIWNEASVTNGLGHHDDEDCTPFTFAPVTVAKSTTQVQQLTDGNWQIDYQITVTNGGTVPAPYTLVDTPKPDTSFDIVSQGWVGATPGDEIAPVGTPVVWNYRVVVKAKTGDAFNEKTATTCTEAQDGKSGSGGFYNTVTATYLGGTVSADSCGVPVKPSIVKTGAAVQDPATGLWTVTYTVTVRNDDPAKIALAYTLGDVAASVPAGAQQQGGWTVNPATITGGEPADTATADAAWAGSGALGAGYITPGATHTYTVSATYKVLASADPDALTCQEEGPGGLSNSATVTNGIGQTTDDACVAIPVPKVTIKKTVTSTALQDDGRWKITYDVKVTGDAQLTATYSLSDTLTFGGDIDVLTADSGWTGPGGSSGSFGSSTTAQLATDQAIAKGVTDTYTVTAYATIDQDAFGGDTLTCDDSRTPEAGGFLNVATVTAAGATQTAHDCSEPGFPKIVKEAQSVTQSTTDPDQYDVTYLITVTGGTSPGYYDLSDTPEFAPGLDILSGTATQQLPTPGDPIEIESGDVFAGGVAIAANEVHTWQVTWTIERTSEFDPNGLECTGEPGHGLFNTAALDFGGVVQTGEDCIPLVDRVYPTVSKTVTAVTQDATTGQWTITYDVTATLAENAKGLSAKYDLTDALDYGTGITVDSAVFSGHRSGTFTDGEATLATGEVIASGATHTYTVTVKATVTPAAVEDDSLACIRGESGPEAGGFLNTALMTSGGKKSTAFDCAEPQLPTIEKSAQATTDNPDGSQRVSYLVTVTAPAPVEGDPVSNLGYSLTEQPDALPSGTVLVGDWHAVAVAPSDLTIDEPTWGGTGEWNVVSGAQFTAEERGEGVVTHTYRIWVDIDVTQRPAEYTPCGEGQTGIPVWNTATIGIGAYSDDDRACGSVDWDEVTIDKTAELPGDQTSVQPGDQFTYVLTVHNQGTRPATEVHVTDHDLNARLQIDGLDVTGGVTWGPAPGYVGRDVDLTIDSIGVGQSAEVRISVTFLRPDITEGETPAPLDSLRNVACVDSAEDGTPDCATHEIPTRDITASVFLSCQSDAAVLNWSVRKSSTLQNLPIDMTWLPTSGTPSTVPPSVNFSSPGGTLEWTGSTTWPGAAFTPSGVAIDHPGWRHIVAADIVPGSAPTQYYLPGTSTVMTPAQQSEYVYNGLILDPSTLDFAWREPSTVTFSVNPSLSTTVTYPATSEGCVQARHSTVEIEKSASTKRAMPGDPFSYTIDVSNTSDDSAADGVVVTDAIPSTVKVNDITWAGKGDDSVFPNWKSCTITGQNSAGYGGNLTCELFGPLQPTGQDGSTAPQITLGSVVSTSAPAGAITNVGVVNYYTFGDPEDAGRDSDDAVVLVSLLPATGGSLPIWVLWSALTAVVVGTGVVLVVTRRRREAGTR